MLLFENGVHTARLGARPPTPARRTGQQHLQAKAACFSLPYNSIKPDQKRPGRWSAGEPRSGPWFRGVASEPIDFARHLRAPPTMLSVHPTKRRHAPGRSGVRDWVGFLVDASHPVRNAPPVQHRHLPKNYDGLDPPRQSTGGATLPQPPQEITLHLPSRIILSRWARKRPRGVKHSPPRPSRGEGEGEGQPLASRSTQPPTLLTHSCRSRNVSSVSGGPQ